jgi:hypothetical protein
MKPWVVVIFAVPLLVSRGTSAHSAASPVKASWSAPRNPLELTRKAGLVPERHETLIHHVHSHLDVFVNRKPVVVPAGIGINMCQRPCISSLHTHDTSGVLHPESASAVPHRLGQFFTEWGVQLSRSCVNVYCSPTTKITIYVDGKRYNGDPTKIQLLDQREIAVVVGKPPQSIPSTFPH